jgi:3-mercaptopropionate dioxygenase
MVSLNRPIASTGLAELVTAVRSAIDRRADWRETARLVARELEHHLPSADVLTPEERSGDAEGYCSYSLHTEPDGSFSVVALVWQPGQVTAIHDR